MSEGNHALVSSAKNTGEATAILPVVSTLSFGFAVTKLLEQDEATHISVLIQIALSAIFSLYTTTYSVLEYYYIAMLTASDTKSHYADDQQHFALEEAARDSLAKSMHATLLAFEPWRREARNSLWYSVILILTSGGTQTAVEQGLSWGTGVVSVILLAGIALVPTTVLKFRRTFRPLLGQYRNAARAHKEDLEESTA